MTDNQKIVQIIYPDSRGANIEDILAPEDIRAYIDQLSQVRRYNHLLAKRPGLIDDNSKVHTLRCVYRSSTISFSSQYLVRLMWIHDIPEYTESIDLSAVERDKDPTLAIDQEVAEAKVAQKIFTAPDLASYKDFQLAEEFLRRAGSVLPKDQQALLANVIDLLDGNLVFAFYYALWLQKNSDTEAEDMGPTLKYGLEMREKMLRAVDDERVNPLIRENIHFLFTSYSQVVWKLWGGLEREKISNVMAVEIDKLARIINSK